jgi:bifunctional UDP-N-acetylglucosamine pyrophosphorylase/glucosamine-1-phosphate N-acetyltransferase
VPKVLQKLAGRPLLGHVLATAQALHARRVVAVTGHGAPEGSIWRRHGAGWRPI